MIIKNEQVEQIAMKEVLETKQKLIIKNDIKINVKEGKYSLRMQNGDRDCRIFNINQKIAYTNDYEVPELKRESFFFGGPIKIGQVGEKIGDRLYFLDGVDTVIINKYSVIVVLGEIFEWTKELEDEIIETITYTIREYKNR